MGFGCSKLPTHLEHPLQRFMTADEWVNLVTSTYYFLMNNNKVQTVC